uniref:Uncharacterized protein n=1 Tax=Anguilla anguilla TaxID=7936 RepID=A0A0E9UPH3_ANGAN
MSSLSASKMLVVGTVAADILSITINPLRLTSKLQPGSDQSRSTMLAGPTSH